MVLKKQTVWLLTMLSLVIVLSVYYITSPEQTGKQMAVTNENSKVNGSNEVATQDPANVDVTIEDASKQEASANMNAEDMFTALRLDINDQRSKMTSQLQAVVASTNVSSDERSKALDKMQAIQTMASKESVLEQLILADKNFSDVFVQASEDHVNVIVSAKESSKKIANDIMLLVQDETGIDNVKVTIKKA